MPIEATPDALRDIAAPNNLSYGPWNYTALENAGACIQSYRPSADENLWEIQVPRVINGLTVQEIGAWAFGLYPNHGLRLYIPATVTRLDPMVFAGASIVQVYFLGRVPLQEYIVGLGSTLRFYVPYSVYDGDVPAIGGIPCTSYGRFPDPVVPGGNMDWTDARSELVSINRRNERPNSNTTFERQILSIPVPPVDAYENSSENMENIREALFAAGEADVIREADDSFLSNLRRLAVPSSEATLTQLRQTAAESNRAAPNQLWEEINDQIARVASTMVFDTPAPNAASLQSAPHASEVLWTITDMELAQCAVCNKYRCEHLTPPAAYTQPNRNGNSYSIPMDLVTASRMTDSRLAPEEVDDVTSLLP